MERYYIYIPQNVNDKSKPARTAHLLRTQARHALECTHVHGSRFIPERAPDFAFRVSLPLAARACPSVDDDDGASTLRCFRV